MKRVSVVTIMLALVAVCPAQVQLLGPPLLEGNPGDRYGGQVVFLDDTDGDGVPDFAVGARHSDPPGMIDVGYVDICSGRDGALLARLSGAASQDYFGEQIVAADVNGDLKLDLVVSAPRAEPGAGGNGRVEVFFGPTFVPGNPDIVIPGAAGSNFGRGLHAVDLDGSGAAEIIVGLDGAAAREARVYSYDPMIPAPASYALDLTLSGGTTHFGIGIMAADIDGTGPLEIMVSDLELNAQGNVHVYSASGAPLGSLVGARTSYYGVQMADCGDLDGDGKSDFAVAAASDGGESGQPYPHQTGAVYFYSGATLTNLPGSPVWGTPGSVFGTEVAAIGDLDADGVTEVAVGAPAGAQGVQGPGYVQIISGSTLSTLMTVTDPLGGNGHFGRSVGGGSDVDGDGCPDLLVGAHRQSSDRGAAYLFSRLLVAYPGTGEDLMLAVSVNGKPAPCGAVPLAAGDAVRADLVSPAGTFTGAIPLIVAQPFAQPNAPRHPGVSWLHIDPFTTPPPLIVFDGNLFPLGPYRLPQCGLPLSWSATFVAPGTSIMLQGLVSSALAANGAVSATDAVEFRY